VVLFRKGLNQLETRVLDRVDMLRQSSLAELIRGQRMYFMKGWISAGAE
jgi:hypothetical protein